MAVSPATATPEFVSALLANPEDAQKILAREHPDYAIRVKSWCVLLDAFEYKGGFLDGCYLEEYPREDSTDYHTRKKLARFHNYLESIVDTYARFIFTKPIKRTSANEELNAWLTAVDGHTLDMDGLMRRLLSVALVTSHAGVLVDKTPDQPSDQTKAGEKAQVIASVFTALAIPDWRFEMNQLVAVKLKEAAPSNSLMDPESEQGECQYLVWDKTGWARFDDEGELVGAGVTNLDMVPFAILRPQPSYISHMLGRPLVNASLIKALFNRWSEEDEVLRAQAFSVLTVEVPESGDVAQAKADLGNTVGVAKALVVRGKIQYATPDQNVPGAIRENSQSLVREMYRSAHVRFADSGLQRESADSIRLNFSELNEALQGIAAGMAQVEKEIVRAWCAWNSATPEAAQALFDAAKYEVAYPDEFFEDDLKLEVEAAAEAIRLGLGKTMETKIKVNICQSIDPNLSPEDLATIEGEITAIANEPPLDLVPLDTGNPDQQAINQANAQMGAVNGQ